MLSQIKQKLTNIAEIQNDYSNLSHTYKKCAEKIEELNSELKENPEPKINNMTLKFNSEEELIKEFNTITQNIKNEIEEIKEEMKNIKKQMETLKGYFEELKTNVISFCKPSKNLEILRRGNKNIYLVQNTTEYVLSREFEHLLTDAPLISQDATVIENISLRAIKLNRIQESVAHKLGLFSDDNKFVFEKIGVDSNYLNFTTEQKRIIRKLDRKLDRVVSTKEEKIWTKIYSAIFFQKEFVEKLYYYQKKNTAWTTPFYLRFNEEDGFSYQY